MAWIFSGPERWVADPWIPWFAGAVSLWHDSISGSTSGISWEKCAHVFLRLLFTSRSPMPNPAIRKSSAITSTPSRSSTNSCMVRCHTSGASGSIGTAQMVCWMWFYKFKADDLLIQCLSQLNKALYIAYKCKECHGNWQSIMVHKIFPIPFIRCACRKWW